MAQIMVGNERRILFEITADPFYSEENINHLKSVIEEIESGRAVLKEHELSVPAYLKKPRR